jgi:chaperonin GroEL
VVRQVRTGNGGFGFNAENEEYESLTAVGITDPTKVPRTAPENASSIAGLMITTGCLVTEAPAPPEE